MSDSCSCVCFACTQVSDLYLDEMRQDRVQQIEKQVNQFSVEIIHFRNRYIHLTQFSCVPVLSIRTPASLPFCARLCIHDVERISPPPVLFCLMVLPFFHSSNSFSLRYMFILAPVCSVPYSLVADLTHRAPSLRVWARKKPLFSSLSSVRSIKLLWTVRTLWPPCSDSSNCLSLVMSNWTKSERWLWLFD